MEESYEYMMKNEGLIHLEEIEKVYGLFPVKLILGFLKDVGGWVNQEIVKSEKHCVNTYVLLDDMYNKGWVDRRKV